TISSVMEKGNTVNTDEISAQLSELRVNMGADAKESHRLLNITSNNVRTDLQQLGGPLDAISKDIAADTKETHKLLKATFVLLKQNLVSNADKE
ncbi:MAG: hypothetical protein KAJ19_05400, partial [Gammaproteobacteria bacterium]|nr:hypothetical protein [Gammaproteobacteria bacterium]